jgi:hypothetical protein
MSSYKFPKLQGDPQAGKFEHRTYVTARKFAEMNGYREVRTVYKAIKAGRIDGVVTFDGVYCIPADARIVDRRVTTGRMIGWRIKQNMERDE